MTVGSGSGGPERRPPCSAALAIWRSGGNNLNVYRVERPVLGSAVTHTVLTGQYTMTIIRDAWGGANVTLGGGRCSS